MYKRQILVTCAVFALAALPSFFLLRERARPSGKAQETLAMLKRLAYACLLYTSRCV